MSYQYIAGVGLIHFNEAKPPRVVPGPERHKWDISKLPWGESTTCLKCGCIKRRKKLRPDWIETYQMPNGEEVTERPACTNSLLDL